jgi:riboflavin synthase
MFTGIVDDVGTIESVKVSDAGRELRVRSAYSDLQDGESIALNGVCLTVREFGDGWFDVAAVETTIGRTTVGDWHEGTRVNLERALRFGDRLGGHLVQGHVDCTMPVLAVEREGDALLINLDIPPVHESLIVLHGSIAVDGVSLTVNQTWPGGLQLSLIEYTLRHTTLGDLRAGQLVNVETDIIGKHVQQLLLPFLEHGLNVAQAAGVTPATDFSRLH